MGKGILFNDTKRVVRLAVPLMLTRVVNAASNFIAMAMIARLGHFALAASSIAFAIYATFTTICFGILFATGIVAAKSYGAKKYELVGHIIRQGLILAVLLAIICFLIIWNIAPILTLFHQKPVLIPYAKTFTQAIAFSLLPCFIVIVLQQYATAVSKPRIITLLCFVNFIITVSFCYLLIFGKFGFPKFGMAGMGYAYTITFCISAIFLLIYFFKHKYFHPFKLMNRLKGTGFKYLWKIIKLGTPMGIQFGGEVGAFAARTMIIGLFGAVALSASQIASQVFIIALMIPFAISEAVSICIGHAMGEKSYSGIRRYALGGYIFAAGLTLLAALVMWFFPHLLVQIFFHDKSTSYQKVSQLAIEFLLITGFFLLFDTLRNIVTGGLRGIHDSKTPMYIGVSIFWLLGLPLGAVLAYVCQLGPIGMPIGSLIAVIFGSIFIIFRFLKKTEKFYV